jgi:hypothetical protein
MRRNRKDRSLKQIFARVFQKPRIALAADDFVVNAPGFFARANFADQFFAVFPDGELDDRSRFRYRKKICSFERIRRVIAEICSTRVVATCPLIRVSSLIDLTGKAFGIGCGRGTGRHGRASQKIGTTTPLGIDRNRRKQGIRLRKKWCLQ